jgi:hypothetical protein
VSIGPYISDFYCTKSKLVIEIDGSQHLDNKEYDKEREEYFSALGIFCVVEKYKNKILNFVIIILYSLSFFYYCDLYLSHMVTKSPIDFLYGYKQAINYVINNKDRFKDTFITDYYGQPYIFALFYQKYSPTDFRKTVVYNPVSDWGFSLVSSFKDKIWQRSSSKLVAFVRSGAFLIMADKVDSSIVKPSSAANLKARRILTGSAIIFSSGFNILISPFRSESIAPK